MYKNILSIWFIQGMQKKKWTPSLEKNLKSSYFWLPYELQETQMEWTRYTESLSTQMFEPWNYSTDFDEI